MSSDETLIGLSAQRQRAKFLWYFIVILLAINVWLAFQHQSQQGKMDLLQAENSRITGEIADKTLALAEKLKAVSVREANAQAIMDAANQRMREASAVMADSQTASSRSSAQGLRRSSNVEEFQARNDVAINPLAQPLQQSSSHTPQGQLQQRNWGPEQVLGPPNTTDKGDIPTAWAPLASTGAGEEWLHVNYEQPVEIAEVHIRETYNPGAVSKVTAILPNGQEMTLWEGTEPAAEAPVDMTFSSPQGIHAQSVKVYLDRTRVPGWNEIDAIELVGRDGTRQWVSSATASSSYAEPPRNTP